MTEDSLCYFYLVINDFTYEIWSVPHSNFSFFCFYFVNVNNRAKLWNILQMRWIHWFKQMNERFFSFLSCHRALKSKVECSHLSSGGWVWHCDTWLKYWQWRVMISSQQKCPLYVSGCWNLLSHSQERKLGGGEVCVFRKHRADLTNFSKKLMRKSCHCVSVVFIPHLCV